MNSANMSDEMVWSRQMFTAVPAQARPYVPHTFLVRFHAVTLALVRVHLVTAWKVSAW